MRKITLYHISDLHIGQNYRRTQAAFHVTEMLLRQAKPINYLFITGDLVDNGTSKFQADVQDRIISKLAPSFRLITCEGNHDAGFYGILRKDFKPHYERKIFQDAMGDVEVYSLNSMAGEVGAKSFGANGSLGEQQLRDLDSWLSEVRGTFRVVLLHHHPFYTGAIYRLKDADALKEIVKDRVDVLLFGHMHDELRLTEKENKYRIPLIHAAGSITDLNRGKNGKAVYRIKKFTLTDSMEVTEETLEVE